MHIVALTSWTENWLSRRSERRSTLMQRWNNRNLRTRKLWTTLSTLSCSTSKKRPDWSRRGRYRKQISLDCSDFSVNVSVSKMCYDFLCGYAAGWVERSDGGRDEDSASAAGSSSHRPRPRCAESPGARAESWGWAGDLSTPETAYTSKINTYRTLMALGFEHRVPGLAQNTKYILNKTWPVWFWSSYLIYKTRLHW